MLPTLHCDKLQHLIKMSKKSHNLQHNASKSNKNVSHKHPDKSITKTKNQSQQKNKRKKDKHQSSSSHLDKDKSPSPHRKQRQLNKIDEHSESKIDGTEDRNIPQDVRIAVIGNVDSGKSTMIGVLTSGECDDGRGSARSRILRHNHERSNGRTSC